MLQNTLSRLATLSTLLATLALIGCDKNNDTNIEQWPAAENCDLHTGPCSVEYNNAKVSIRIDPEPIPVARPLGVQLKVQNLKAKQVQLDISGINMYMGYNRVNLIPKRADYWVGTSMLAFCTAEKMQWQLTVMLTLEDGREVQVPFMLETSNRGK